jgi:hypothetical protein
MDDRARVALILWVRHARDDVRNALRKLEYIEDATPHREDFVYRAARNRLMIAEGIVAEVAELLGVDFD